MKFWTPGPGIADAVVAYWHVPCTRASAVSVLPACTAHHLPYHAAVCSARGCRPPTFKIASSTFFPISHNYSFHLQLLSLLKESSHFSVLSVLLHVLAMGMNFLLIQSKKKNKKKISFSTAALHKKEHYEKKNYHLQITFSNHLCY